MTNGSIEIPDGLKDKLVGLVRVIILAEEKPAKAEMIDRLLAAPIRLESSEPLTREEIYERS